MLARLGSIEGLINAETDHRGELLRIVLRERGALDEVWAALAELGYDAELADRSAVPPDVRWHGALDVRDLSREEADVIARRVVPAFARAHGIAGSSEVLLTTIVRDTLYACFSAHELRADSSPGALRAECSRAVQDAAVPMLGVAPARELGAALWTDLGGTHVAR